MKSTGKKLSVECQKFQFLGKISTLTAFLYELDENENNMSNEYLFQLIYECYNKMHEFASHKELIIKFASIKQAKRQCNIMISYMTGVISKIKQALQIQSLTSVDYFNHAYQKVNAMLG
jgi:hypothetical protein